jgi:hypothetical protein
VVALLVGVCGLGTCWYIKHKADEAASEFQRQLGGLDTLLPTNAPGDEPASSGEPTGSGGPAGSSGPPGVSDGVWATCEKARSCCRAVYSRTNLPGGLQSCDGFEQSVAGVLAQPEGLRDPTLRVVCGSGLTSFRQAARSVAGGSVSECD